MNRRYEPGGAVGDLRNRAMKMSTINPSSSV
jgi:hypothetical protein